MSAEDITKAKGKGKGKKRSRFSERVNYHVNAGHIRDYLSPAYAAADGEASETRREMARADVDKEMSPHGNPAPHGVHPDERLSEPLTQGRAAASPGDHGVNQGRSMELAWQHHALRQSDPTVRPFARYGPDGNSGFAGAAALSEAERLLSHPLRHAEPQVVTQSLDARSHAGSYRGADIPGAGCDRPAPGQHRGSATPPNGSHSINGNVQSHAVSTKQLRDSIKAAMKAQGIFG